MKTIPIIMGVLVVGLSPLMAEARGMGSMPSFEMLDRDGSGSLSAEDFEAGLQGMRGALHDHVIARLMEQADEDGRLDEDALRAGFAALHDERQVGRQGARRAMMQSRLFDRIDSNNDGVIDAAEYDAFLARRSERMEQRGQRGPRGHGGHGRRE